ncbi:MAG: RcpC/CpaB family pilus assembly protein, partial [Thermacetogeniaceae bacterium]
MSRKAAIVVSLVLALVFTLLIVGASNRKYSEATQSVEVAQTTHFIPAGAELKGDDVKAVKVVKSAAKGLASVSEAVGKTAKVPMLKGQYVYKDALDTAKAVRPGYVEVFVPVDISSSAFSMSGQRVNVYVVNKDTGAATVLLENVRVLHSLTSQGQNVGEKEGGVAAAQSTEPATVGLEVPKDKADAVVQAAAAKQIYLVRVGAD